MLSEKLNILLRKRILNLSEEIVNYMLQTYILKQIRYILKHL